jgi:hypothetical protein
MIIVFLLVAMIPIGLYFWREHKMGTPSLQWPVLANILGLKYEAGPPRMSGEWSGRRVAVESVPNGVALTAWLSGPTSLRVECGPKELVTQRAGIVLPDPVEPLDASFRDKLLARCSYKPAGPTIFDAGLQKRLAALKHVDFVGEDTRVVWTAPELKDPDSAERILGSLCAVADGLEHFPAGTGGRAP